MKRLLSILGALTIGASSAATVVSCSTNGYQSNLDNTDSNSTLLVNDEFLQEKVEQSALAKVQSLILDDNYGLSHSVIDKTIMEQNANSLIKNQDNVDGSINDYYKELFNDGSLNKVIKDMKLSGTLGNEGGIIDAGYEQIMDLIHNLVDKIGTYGTEEQKLNIKDIINKLIDQFLGGSKQEIVKKLTDLLKMLPMILQSLDSVVVISGLPVALAGLEKLDIFQQAFLKVIQQLINQITKAIEGKIPFDKIEKYFSYFNMEKYGEYNTQSMQKLMFTDLTNIVGSVFVQGYQALEVKDNKPEDIGTKLADILDKIDTNNMNFDDIAIESIINLMMTFTNLLGLYSDTKNIEPIDQNHLFSNDLDNIKFLQSYKNKKMKESTLFLNKNRMNIVALINELNYYFGNLKKDKSSMYKIAKFINVILGFDKEPRKFGSIFVKGNSIFGEIITKILTIKVPKIKSMATTIQGYMEILFTSVINANKPIADTLQSIVKLALGFIEGNNDSEKQIITILNVILKMLEDDSFNNETFELFYDGDFLGLFERISNEEKNNEFLKPIFKMVKKIENQIGGSINICNLMNTKLSTILKLANVPGFSDEDIQENNGLMPNYAGFYIDKTITELISELGTMFGVDGTQTPDQLKYNYLDLDVVMKLIKTVIGNNGILNKVIESIGDPEKMYQLLGYKVENHVVDTNSIRVDSFLGQFLILTTPILGEKHKDDSGYIDVDKEMDASNVDNFKMFMGGIARFIENMLKGTDYSNWVNKVIDPNNKAFNIDKNQTKVEYFKNTEIIKSEKILVNFNPEGIVVGNGVILKGFPPHGKYYTIYISRDDANGVFNFDKIEKEWK